MRLEDILACPREDDDGRRRAVHLDRADVDQALRRQRAQIAGPRIPRRPHRLEVVRADHTEGTDRGERAGLGFAQAIDVPAREDRLALRSAREGQANHGNARWSGAWLAWLAWFRGSCSGLADVGTRVVATVSRHGDSSRAGRSDRWRTS